MNRKSKPVFGISHPVYTDLNGCGQGKEVRMMEFQRRNSDLDQFLHKKKAAFSFHDTLLGILSEILEFVEEEKTVW